MDATELYSSTLERLNQVIIQMTSPEWDANTHAASANQRQQALLAMLRVQHARLALGNAALQTISDALKDNEQSLIKGWEAVQAAFSALTTVQSTLKAVTAFVNVVAKIVPLV